MLSPHIHIVRYQCLCLPTADDWYRLARDSAMTEPEMGLTVTRQPGLWRWPLDGHHQHQHTVTDNWFTGGTQLLGESQTRWEAELGEMWGENRFNSLVPAAWWDTNSLTRVQQLSDTRNIGNCVDTCKCLIAWYQLPDGAQTAWHVYKNV